MAKTGKGKGKGSGTKKQNSSSSEKEKKGYGNPPKDKQWVKGQSGNPAGRPKASKTLKSLIYEAGDEKIMMMVDGKKKKVSLKEAAARKYWEYLLKKMDYKLLQMFFDAEDRHRKILKKKAEKEHVPEITVMQRKMMYILTGDGDEPINEESFREPEYRPQDEFDDIEDTSDVSDDDLEED